MKRSHQRLHAFVKASLSRLGTQVRRALLTDADVTVDTAEGERAEARAFAESAASLRGGMAKLAQLRAYSEGPGSAGDREARAALAALWDEVPGDEPEKIRRVIEADLGEKTSSLFASFDERPLAAASLGQVHAAVAHGTSSGTSSGTSPATSSGTSHGSSSGMPPGQELAVKVQYPGVAEALRDDLASGRFVKRLAGTDVGAALDPAAVESLRASLLAELDYVAEATHLEAFRHAFSGDPSIVIPRAFSHLSSGRVLTMERLRGRTLASLAASGSTPERSAVARTIFRFAWAAPLVHGLLNADPNPGNYLVLDEPGESHAPRGRVGFLDFGCVVRLDPDLVSADRALFYAMIHRDGEALRHALHRQGLVENATVYDTHSFRSFERYFAGPFLERGDVTLRAEDVSELSRLFGHLVKSRGIALPAHALLLWRQRLGVLAVIASLRPRFNVRAVLAEILDDGHPEPLLRRYP